MVSNETLHFVVFSLSMNTWTIFHTSFLWKDHPTHSLLTMTLPQYDYIAYWCCCFYCYCYCYYRPRWL